MVKIIGSEAVGLHIIKKILEKKQGLTGDEKVQDWTELKVYNFKCKKENKNSIF